MRSSLSVSGLSQGRPAQELRKVAARLQPWVQIHSWSTAIRPVVAGRSSLKTRLATHSLLRTIRAVRSTPLVGAAPVTVRDYGIVLALGGVPTCCREHRPDA